MSQTGRLSASGGTPMALRRRCSSMPKTAAARTAHASRRASTARAWPSASAYATPAARRATSRTSPRVGGGLCVRSYCGPMGEYQDESRVQIWESADYGVNWKLTATFDSHAYPLGYSASALIVERTERTQGGFDHYLLELPGG